jgi:hypothetical protein
MPFFRLTPVARRLHDPDWSASLHRRPCYVAAPDARRARSYAASAFTELGAVRTAGGLLPLIGLGDARVPEGAVMLGDGSGTDGRRTITSR